MDRDFHTFQARIEAILPTLATKADMEALRADVARWTLATVIGLFVGFAGLFVAISNMLRPMAPQTAAVPPVAVAPALPGASAAPSAVTSLPAATPGAPVGQMALIIVNRAPEPASAPHK